MFKFYLKRNETSEKMIGEKELEKYMDRDFQCLSHSSVNYGTIGDRYCQCGKKRSVYPCEFANFWYTNVSCSGRRETSSDDILKVDRNTIFLTKKNLMMNQFLEYTNSTPPPSPPLKSIKPEVDDKIPWLHPSFPRSRIAIRNVAETRSACDNSCSVKSNRRTTVTSAFCSSSSPFLDKRIVSLLRGITLYWFICLNTVLAKSELLKKKSPIALVSDINCDSATALLNAISATDSTSVPPFCHALVELQVSLNLLENAFDLDSDILWNLFRDSFVEQSQLQNHAVIVLPFDQHSKNNLFEQFVYKLVNGWINMWRNFNEMPTPMRYCPYRIPNSFNYSQNENVEPHEIAQDERHSFIEVNPNYHYQWPANEMFYAAFPSHPYSISYHNHIHAPSLGFPYHVNEWPVLQHESLLEIDYSHRPVSPPSFDMFDRNRNHSYCPAETVEFDSHDSNHTLQMSNTEYWNVIAQEFGDPETNAAFANDAANTNGDYNLNRALIPGNFIKVEPEDSPTENMDGQLEVEEATENEYVDVVNECQNNLAVLNSEGNRCRFERQYSVESPTRFDGEACDNFGSYVHSSPDHFQRNALDYSIHFDDGQDSDINRSPPFNHFEPRNYGGHSLIGENDVLQAELPREPSPEIDPSCVDVADVAFLSAPAIGADGKCNPSACSEAHSNVKLDTCQQSANEVTNIYDLKATFATNSLFDAPHISPLSPGGHQTSINNPDFRSPLPPSVFGADQAAVWQEAPALELPIEPADHGKQSTSLATNRSTSNNSGVTKDGDAPSSESDDSELIALTHPLDVHQLPAPAENRYFLPQGILGGGQQECAEFNMWRWPWVNSVQLLRQEPHPPRLTDESSDEFPQYHMWKMPQVNVVSRQHARTLQQPAVSAVSRLLLTPSLRSDASLNRSSEYSLWSSPKLVDVEQLSSMERQSIETSNTATNPMPSHDNVCAAGVQFPRFVPITRGRVTFSSRGAFHHYRRQPPLPDGDVSENLQMRIQPSTAQLHLTTSEPMSDYVDELDADEEVRNLTDEDEQSASAPVDSPYLFRPLAPAFKVLKDVQPPLLRSASGLEYQLNGRKLFVFQHELDAKSNNPYLFQPKYAVSLNDKGCQTEPELLYACAVTNVSCSPFPVHGEPSTTSHTARPRLSPNLAASQGWPLPHHHQPAGQAASQHFWPSYQAPVSAANASTSQPWSTTQFPSPSQPAPPFWTAVQQPDQQTWAVGQLQYYSLNDVFSHLGQPGFANVGEYDLPLAMTFSST